MKWFLTWFAIVALYPNSAQTDNQAVMQDRSYPYEVHHIALFDSLNIAYVDEGQGPNTLLFIHGLGSNLKAWRKNIDHLVGHYRCIALDLPGYGGSDMGVFPFSMNFFANTIQGFVAAMDLEQVVLVGHSMGGQIALHTALKKDEHIEKLILVAPAGFETFTEKEKSWFKSTYTPSVLEATPESQIVTNFHLNFYAFPNDAQFMIDDRLEMRHTQEYKHYCQMIPHCVMGMLNEPVFDRLTEITLPTLIVFGEDDKLIPNSFFHPDLTTRGVAQSGQNKIPNSELVLIPSAGHFVQWEQAGRVNEVIWEFLKED